MFRTKKSTPSAIVFVGKAGSLTKDQPSVRQLWRPEYATEDSAGIILNAASSSDDPLDAALRSFAVEKGAAPLSQPPVVTLPFDQSHAMSGNLWHHGVQYQLFVKGAPEQMLTRCDLTENEREHAIAELHKLAGRGYSVLALAHMTLTKQIFSFADLGEKTRFAFDGLVALEDDVQLEAKNAIREAKEAGNPVYIITGDHPETAFQIAKKLGVIRSREQVLDARQLNITKEEAFENARIFAHAAPADTSRILEILEKQTATSLRILPSTTT